MTTDGVVPGVGSLAAATLDAEMEAPGVAAPAAPEPVTVKGISPSMGWPSEETTRQAIT
ncbi:hypothetical protein [Microtetraspora malaysiensis]|uniref:hypothetical protein n=1 Tax=Microtetraspora malaysiensis TaxID=161358 RepID=UPI003D9498E4